MERTRFVDHGGTRILLIDFSGLREPAEIFAQIERTEAVVARQPPKSLRVLTDVSDARYNSEVIQALKGLMKHDEPYVRASAVVGVDGIKRAVLSTLILFSKRRLEAFDTREQAMDWLAAQP